MKFCKNECGSERSIIIRNNKSNYGNKHYLLHGKASMFEIFLEVWRTENKKHE